MSAVISACGQYRYRLERTGTAIADHGTTAVIMVNPSTADAVDNDPTIRKLIGFAAWKSWGELIVGNLFAYRATDVRQLAKVIDPIGPGNDAYLKAMAQEADRVIFAWGPVSKQPKYQRARWRTVDAIFRDAGHEPLSIGEPAKCGHPKHPLMLPYASAILPWSFPQ